MPAYCESHSLGVSLTGGLDSRMIMSCHPAMTNDVVAYTFAAPSGDTVDVRLAREVARASGVPHHVLRLGPEFFSSFGSLVDRTVYLTDGYWGVCGAHEIHLTSRARQLSQVRLTGNFGSEILRGATTFKPLGVSADLVHPDLRQWLSYDPIRASRATIHPASFAAFTEIPWHSFGVFRAAQSQVTMRTPFLANDLVALAFRAPKALLASSGPSLRLIRENDSTLAQIRTDSGSLPASRLSSLLGSLWYRSSFKVDYWRNAGWPPPFSALDAFLRGVVGASSILPEHRFLHYRQWFRTELAEYVREHLTDREIVRSGRWNGRFLEHMAEAHISGRRNYLREIDTVLTCCAIDRLLLSGNARAEQVLGSA